ncbi:PREDICTED: transcription initiation factor TFIID subunit 4B [Nanorana parkeri]|uniref:transcription initiation factor TFIID subunit 4B n=1 Tax=Nanorana parkeri TaxID=125878 RepID=UPI0008540D8D|nr:PREDICTED: transcription initiation factor TFIID subunit 4B [Nanorana parkeri]
MSTPDRPITPSQVESGPPASLSQVSVAPQTPVISAPMCTLITKVAPAAVQASKVTSGPKMTATQQSVPAKAAQTTIQLPANFQIPPGTVLVRTGNGQLMLVSQQALARAQAQVQNAKPRAPNAQTVHIANVQTAGTPSNATKVSSLVSKAGPSVPVPTVVRICTTPQTIANSQGTSTVIIRAPAPLTTPITTLSRTLPSVVTVPASTGVSSAASVNSTTVTMVPVRTSSPTVTPVTNHGTSIMAPATIVSSTTTTSSPTASSVLHIMVNPVKSNIVQTTVPSNSQQVTASSPALKVASKNSCFTTSTTVASAPIIVSCIAPASTMVHTVVTENNPPQQMQTSTPAITSSVVPKNAEPSSKLQSTQLPNHSQEAMDNVKKCKNFLATLIKLASSGPQSPTMGQNVKNLVKNLLDSKLEAEEFTTKLYKELKSSPQPYLVPFLKKSLPSLRRMMPNSQEFILQCGPQNSTPPVTATNSLSFVKITPTTPIQTIKPASTTIISNAKVPQATIAVPQQLNSLKAMNFKQLVVQQPAGGVVKHVTALPSRATVTLKPGEKQISLNTLIQAGHLAPGSVLKQITLPGNKVISLQASPLPVKENGAACFREEDDINDVTSMAGVNLNEENACILATNSELVGAVIRSCKDEPFLFASALQTRILDIGKRHDIKELNSDVMNLLSHATQERLRGLIEKLTVVAQHRSTNYKQSDRYVQSSEVRAQLKFLEQLEHLERQRKHEEEREMLLRAAKSRSNKEDPEQIRLKQKAKELQQLELEQLQYREANLTALAAIGPRRKRPLESSHLHNVLEEYQGSESSVFRIPKSMFVPRITRVSLRDLIFCMEQERMSRYSLSLYRALLK